MFATASAGAEVRTFQDPTHGGFAVSYCGGNGTGCGEQVATSWCRSHGYEYAQEWAATSGDATTRTVSLDDGAFCNGAQCDAFGSITCGRESQPGQMPQLGALAMSTVISPSRRNAELSYDSVEFDVLIPGCHQTDPGTFLCESVYEYQHCRTLMRSGRVFSCRAGLAFEGGFAEPVAAKPGDYVLSLESSAEVRVDAGVRGPGRIRGDVEFEIAFKQPKLEYAFWCLQRDRYVYETTGPSGGLADIDDIDDCDEPVKARFEPNEDDLLRAFDLCNAFDAWGNEIEDTIDVIVASLFHLDSANPRFRAEHGDAGIVIAPYLTVKAPMKIVCRD